MTTSIKTSELRNTGYWYDNWVIQYRRSKALAEKLEAAEKEIEQLRGMYRNATERLEYQARRADDWQEEAERRLKSRQDVIDDVLKVVSEHKKTEF